MDVKNSYFLYKGIKKRKRTYLAYKQQIGKLRNLLFDCYANLLDLYGNDGDDFLTGHENRLSFSEAKKNGEELKIKIRKLL